jgi:hypothetical protein
MLLVLILLSPQLNVAARPLVLGNLGHMSKENSYVLTQVTNLECGKKLLQTRYCALMYRFSGKASCLLKIWPFRAECVPNTVSQFLLIGTFSANILLQKERL